MSAAALRRPGSVPAQNDSFVGSEDPRELILSCKDEASFDFH